MAAKQDKTKSTPDQNQPTDSPTTVRTARASSAADPAQGALPDAVAEAIDTERAKLLQAHAVLKCLQQVLEHAEDDDAQYCADSAEMIARVIDDVVAQLDLTRLKRLAKAPKGGYGVREPALPYYASTDFYALAPLSSTELSPEHRVS
jgi:hypothetical protein